MFLGNLLEFKRKDSFSATSEWSKKYGGIFVMWLRPDRPLVYLTDIELVKQVLVTNCYKYLRPSLVRLLIPSLGNSLLTSNGKDHAWLRKMINPAFSYTNLKGMVPFMKTATGDLVQFWKEKLQRSAQKDYADIMVQSDLFRLTLDIIGQTAFGYQFKSVREGDTEVTNAFNHMTTGVDLSRLSLLTLPFFKYLPLEENRLKKNATEITNEVVMKVIKERRHMMEMGRQPACRNLLDIAMDMVDDRTGTRLDDYQLRALVFTFLFAGHETTGVSMSWTLYELAKYPQIQEKIRKEANEVLGDGTEITWAKLDELQYLSNVIKESMRLHPVVSQVGRESAQDDTLGGYHIPANTHLLIGVHVIHHSEKYWPDPETFKPERFENLTQEQESLVRYILMPFSFGPRICIGNKLAMAEMRLVLASLLQKFIFSPVPGFPEVKPKMSLTSKPFPSLQLRIRAVDSDA